MALVKRGEVWLATLDPTIGSEIRKTRPCLIVSPDELNDVVRTVLIAPMTSGSRRTAFRVPVAFLGTEGFILPEQMRSLDKSRLLRRLGVAPSPAVQAALTVLRDMFEP